MAPTTKTETGPKLRADARRNHEAVLKAARQSFARRGIDCQMEEIAKAAGVGVGTVYRHFPTKSDLLYALLEARFQHLAERAEKALAEDDPWEAFCDFMRYSGELQVRDRALSQIMSSSPELGRNPAVETGLVDLTDQLMTKAKRAGGMRKDAVVEDVPTLVCALAAVIAGAAGKMPELNWERYIEIVLDGLKAPGSNKLPPPRATIER